MEEFIASLYDILFDLCLRQIRCLQSLHNCMRTRLSCLYCIGVCISKAVEILGPLSHIDKWYYRSDNTFFSMWEAWSMAPRAACV
jgi:hypothetical protein